MEDLRRIKGYKKLQKEKYSLKKFNKEIKIEKENKKVEIITEKMRNLEEKISHLEYKKEGYIQQLNTLQKEETKSEEEFNKAKESENVEELVKASEKVKSIRDKMKPLDTKLQLIKARIAINMLRLTRLRESYIKKTKNIKKLNGVDDFTSNIEEEQQRRMFRHNDKNRIAREQQKYKEDSEANYFEGNYDEEDKKITPIQAKIKNTSVVINSNTEEIVQTKNDGPIKIGDDEEKFNDEQRKEIEMQSKNRLKNRLLRSLPGRIFYVYPKAFIMAIKEKMDKSEKLDSMKKGSKKLLENFKQAKNELLEDLAQKIGTKALPAGKFENEEKTEKKTEMHTEIQKNDDKSNLKYDQIIEIGKFELGVEQQEPVYLKDVKLKDKYIDVQKAMEDAKSKANLDKDKEQDEQEQK